jgi:hypothetical protein
MTPQITIITPIAPYHLELSAQAIAAVRAQTIPVVHLAAVDEAGRGPAVLRNELLASVETEYVIFLDADDTINAAFAERCLSFALPDRYVYVDWYEGDLIKYAPDCPWTDGTWHPITTLIPTEWVHRVGGFDETLTGAEDTQLYLKLCTSGCCGRHLPFPLFHYGEAGRRARQFIQSPAYHQTMERFTIEFGGKQVACCGNNVPMDEKPVNEPEPGDVLVQAVWSGNRMERGMHSGRLYPRTGNGKQVYVDPRDAQAQPHLWRLVVETPKPPTVLIERAEPAAVKSTIPVVEGVAGVAEALYGVRPPMALEDMLKIAPAQVTPDVGALRRLTGNA